MRLYPSAATLVRLHAAALRLAHRGEHAAEMACFAAVAYGEHLDRYTALAVLSFAAAAWLLARVPLPE